MHCSYFRRIASLSKCAKSSFVVKQEDLIDIEDIFSIYMLPLSRQSCVELKVALMGLQFDRGGLPSLF